MASYTVTYSSSTRQYTLTRDGNTYSWSKEGALWAVDPTNSTRVIIGQPDAKFTLAYSLCTSPAGATSASNLLSLIQALDTNDWTVNDITAASVTATGTVAGASVTASTAMTTPTIQSATSTLTVDDDLTLATNKNLTLQGTGELVWPRVGYVSVARTAQATRGASGWLDVNWQSEVADALGFYDGGSSTTNVTAGFNCYMVCIAQARIKSTAAGFRDVAFGFAKNTETTGDRNRFFATLNGAADFTVAVTTSVIEMSASDYVHLMWYCADSGATIGQTSYSMPTLQIFVYPR